MLSEMWLGISIAIVIFTFYSLYETIWLYKKKNDINLWKIISFILSSFLSVFSFYTYYFIRFRGFDQRLGSFMLIYVFSAIFVIFIIRRANMIISGLKNKEKEYMDLNLKLEYETQNATKKLEEKVRELEKSRSAMINILDDISLQKNELETSKASMEKLNKRLERTNKELTTLDKQKDQFTSITAHELKTPLASIRGFIQLLQNKKIFNDKEKREKYMGIIVSDTQRLSKLVTDILDISRLDLGTLKFYFDNISVFDLIESVKHEMSPIISAKKIKEEYIVEKNVPAGIYGDKDRLMQVISNLINNAVHYTNEGGKISVKVSTKEKDILFSIKDTGIGIPKSKQKEIFERFVQVDSWLTRKIGGSGLGLSICKGIVKGMGGKIWVESAVGKGSTFYFTIPGKTSSGFEEQYKKYVKLFEEDPKKKIKVEESI